MKNIFFAADKQHFLSQVIEILQEKCPDFSKVKIAMPSALLCLELQQELINIYSSCVLPQIAPLNAIINQNEPWLKAADQQVTMLSRLEENITLAQVIHQNAILKYNLVQSLQLAPTLGNLLFELAINQLDISQLNNIATVQQAEHWQQICLFLEVAKNKWQEILLQKQRITAAQYQTLMLDAEFTRLQQNSDEILIMAGFTASHALVNDFIKKALQLPNAVLIFPPGANILQQLDNNVSPEHGLYKLHSLFGQINKHYPTNLPVEFEPSIFNSFMLNQEQLLPQQLNKTQYIEFDSDIAEAEYIALQCMRHLAKADVKIGIILPNSQNTSTYSLFLKKYNIDFHNQFGQNASSLPIFSLLFLIAENIAKPFSITNFLALISHPLLQITATSKLKILIHRKQRFADSWQKIVHVAETSQDHEIEELVHRFAPIYQAITVNLDLVSLITYCAKLLDQLLPKVWEAAPQASQLLAEIISLNHSLNIDEVAIFPELFKQLIQPYKIPTGSRGHVVLCNLDSASLINFDYIYITNVNEEHYPYNFNHNPWVNNKIQQALKLEDQDVQYGNNLYHFFLNLDNQHVTLTRSLKIAGSYSTISPLVLITQKLFGQHIQNIHAKQVFDPYAPDQLNTITKQPFPQILFATDIELLIQAPYNFYAKKILNLRKLRPVSNQPEPAEFGNFFHYLVDQYNRHYDDNVPPHKLFQQLLEQLVENFDAPRQSKFNWQQKILAMQNEFINFDQEQRCNNSQIYSEIIGSYVVDLPNNPITIKAIADRISISPDGQACIMDFKTGTAPTKSQVLSGFAPQLMIGAIILHKGNFLDYQQQPIKRTFANQLRYIKIASTAPYFQITEITITPAMLEEYLQDLTALLNYYTTNKTFPIEHNYVKYDEYTNLARRKN